MTIRAIYTAPLVALIALSISSPAALAALPTPDTCPAAPESQTAAYKSGFATGCNAGLTLEEYRINGAGTEYLKNATEYCPGGVAPFPYRATDSVSANQNWVNGCYDGYAAGAGAYGQNLATWPASPKPSAHDICLNLDGYKSLTNPTWQEDFFGACVNSYRKAINNPREADATTFQDFDTVGHDTSCTTDFTGAPNRLNGCRAGFSKARDDFENAFPALSAPDAATVAASEKINNCGLTFIGDQYRNGAQRGCATGFNAGFANAPNTAETDISYDPRSVKQRDYRQGYVEGYNAGYTIGTQQHGKCLSQGSTDYTGVPCTTESGGAIVPRCNPALPPSDPGGCGIPAFVQLIKNIIGYLMAIAIPLAVLALGWGGFQIMTAAGNTGKVEEGRQSITVAVVGIIIMLVSYLVVKLVFVALGVDSTIIQGIF